jgi:hypothetical protein
MMMMMMTTFKLSLLFILLVKCWGKALLSASEKISVCAYRDQFPLASEQNIANPFFFIM